MKHAFNRIAIIGVGLIGGSLAAALKRKRALSVVGIDFEAVVAKALAMGVIDAGFSVEDIGTGVRDADLVVLATPAETIVDTLRKVGPHLAPGTLVTDVASTKSAIVTAAREILPPQVFFMGGHPMAGLERGGVEQAEPLLFENAIYVLTPGQDIPQLLVASFVELVESVGAKAVFLSAEQHDRIAAAVSHLPHVLAVTLMNYAARLNAEDSAYLKLGAGGFRDMTRVASSPHLIWEQILAANRANVQMAISDFIAELERMREAIATPSAADIFQAAARHRLAIPRDTRGFMRPHFDLYVVVEDRPGVIASISSALASAEINIKDIEVVKVREDDAGTIRLAFESDSDRREAMKLLKKIDFDAKIKD